MKCCDIKAGMLRRKVAFERLGAPVNVDGDIVRVWGAITGAPTRARVVAASGFERAQADRTNAEVAYRVTVRYFAGLKEADSVLINGRRHNITFIDNVELANKWLVISVSGGVAV